ncbi:MAG: N-acetylmuramoyl-L-alanine amidase [Smithella sp.]
MKIKYALIILIVFWAFADISGAAEISNVRYWAAPDHTRVVIDVSGESSFKIQEDKSFLVLNFKEGSLGPELPAEILINKPGIKKVTICSISEGSVEVKLILDKYLKTEVFKLKKFQDKPDRIVVDIFLQGNLPKETVKCSPSRVKRKKVIVVDPGHGGDDPGAVGKNGTYEKDIVLSLSREIKKAINKNPEYRAVLTRDGDYYVSFSKRLQVAKDLNASLFISVHADAARNRQAKGSSVYCLSTGAASNEAAKLLAKNENLSDIIGGVPNGEGNGDSDQIILNMFQTNTINLSKTYAVNLMQQLNDINTLKYQSVQEAPFRVLKLPDIPAVLIETAFISNGEEEKLLKSKSFQKKIALAIDTSVREYLSGATAIAQNSGTVEENDEPIASVREKSTKKVNTGKRISRIYRVKKGDTLFSLAKNNSITIDELRRLNNMRGTTPLLWGQKIRLP